MSNISFNFFDKYKSLKKISKKNYANSCYKKAPGKENSENTVNETDNMLNNLEQYSFKKIKKYNNSKKFNVRSKEYYKNGKSTKFNLFREKDLNLDNLGKNIKTFETEEDYDSDDNTIKEGMNKVKEDLIEALRILKLKSLTEISNYKKYCKYNS